MGDRASAVVTIKAKTIKVFAAELQKLLAEEIIDKAEVTVRYNDLTSSFHKYEDAYETLCVLDQNRADDLEWNAIRTLYYSVARAIVKIREPGGSLVNATLPTEAPNANSTVIEKVRLPRLPDAKVPTFNGNYEEWLSFKHAFLSIVNTQSVDDVVKFIHLRNSLTEEALNKVNIFEIRGENYAKAWKTLVDIYERKRILVSKHMNALLDITPAKTVASKEVSRIVDEAKQHLNVLDGLEVKVDDTMAICILERALPFKIRKKWEESLELDEMPKLGRFYKFMGEMIFRLCTLEASDGRERSTSANKRTSETLRDAKARKGHDNVRTLVTNSTTGCAYCKGPHMIFRCPSFGALPVPRRWEFVRSKKLCVNCLRSHVDKCGFGHCKRCDKHHNTLLHDEAKSTISKSSSSTVPPANREGNQTA